MTALTITAATYQAATLYLAWIGTGSGPTAAMMVTLKNSAGTIRTFPATGYYTTIATDLGQDTSWTAAVAPGAGGAASPEVPLLVVVPVVLRVQNTGGAIDVAWAALTGITTFGTALQQTGGSTVDHVVPGLSDSFPGTIDGTGWSCTVRASTPDGVSQGPGASYVPIQAAPTLTSVSYSGAALGLAWAPVAGFTSYAIWLQDGAAAPQRQTVTGPPTGSFAGALGSGSYTTWVTALSGDGICIGPPSQVYVPIQVSPTVTAVTYNGASLTLTWTPAAGFADNLVMLQTIGVQSREQTVKGTTCAFAGPLNGVGANTCTVRAQSSDGVNTGPAAADYTVIIGSPALTEVDYDSGTLGLQWTNAGDPSATGNRIEVTGGATPVIAPLGTSGSQSVAATLAATTPYGAVLYATDGIVTGPGSAAVVPLTAPPQTPTLGFDGTHLRADWAAPAAGSPTGYIAAVAANGTTSEVESTTTLQQVFTSALTADTIFTVQVRATGPNAKGPWSAAATGPYRTTLTYGFDGQSRLHTIGWSNGAAETYGFDGAGNLLSLVRTAPTVAQGG